VLFKEDSNCLLNEKVIFLLLIFIVATPIFMTIFLPSEVKSMTALAKAARESSTACLSSEQALEIGAALQKIILNPFW